MGAGRKTSTYDIDTGAAQLGFVERQRNLGENLGGVIFGIVFPLTVTALHRACGNGQLRFSICDVMQAAVTRPMMSAFMVSSSVCRGLTSVMCSTSCQGKLSMLCLVSSTES